nr:uncharacterized protein LOC112730131 [Arachis hypogaea]
MFASLHINIPFIEGLQQMPSYIKCMKELLTKKNPLKGGQTVVMNKECSALIQKDLPTKKKDPGSFHIPCSIGDTKIDKGFCDLGESINLMPLSLMKKLQINELKPTDVGKYFLLTNFVVLEIEESYLHPIILGRQFLATPRALIDVEQEELVLRIHDEQLTFHVFKPSHEAEQENRDLKDDHNEVLLRETSRESQVEHVKTPLVEIQEVQMIQQPRNPKEELKPQDSRDTIHNDPSDTGIIKAPLEEERRIGKKIVNNKFGVVRHTKEIYENHIISLPMASPNSKRRNGKEPMEQHPFDEKKFRTLHHAL